MSGLRGAEVFLWVDQAARVIPLGFDVARAALCSGRNFPTAGQVFPVKFPAHFTGGSPPSARNGLLESLKRPPAPAWPRRRCVIPTAVPALRPTVFAGRNVCFVWRQLPGRLLAAIGPRADLSGPASPQLRGSNRRLGDARCACFRYLSA